MKKKLKRIRKKYCLNNCYVDLEGEKKKKAREYSINYDQNVVIIVRDI